MKYATTREIGTRALTGVSRMTVEKVDDAPLLQEMHLRGFHSESMDTIEHAHPYGFSTVVKGPTTENGQKMRAEALVTFLAGSRSHGVVNQTFDRRYRPNNLAEGEVVLYDHQGLQVYLSSKGLVIHAPAGIDVHLQTADGSHLLATKDKVKMQNGSASVTCKGGNTYLGAESASHAVVTVDGPSSKVFAAIGESDSEMAMAATAKRTKKGK
jgi:phage gp45-like